MALGNVIGPSGAQISGAKPLGIFSEPHVRDRGTSGVRHHQQFDRQHVNKRLGKIVSWMLLIFVVTGVVSSLLMLGAVKCSTRRR